jgi:hypothetical protein
VSQHAVRRSSGGLALVVPHAVAVTVSVKFGWKHSGQRDFVKLGASDAQATTEHLRQGLVARAPAAKLDGAAEIDEGNSPGHGRDEQGNRVKRVVTKP